MTSSEHIDRPIDTSTIDGMVDRLNVLGNNLCPPPLLGDADGPDAFEISSEMFSEAEHEAAQTFHGIVAVSGTQIYCMERPDNTMPNAVLGFEKAGFVGKFSHLKQILVPTITDRSRLNPTYALIFTTLGEDASEAEQLSESLGVASLFPFIAVAPQSAVYQASRLAYSSG